MCQSSSCLYNKKGCDSFDSSALYSCVYGLTGTFIKKKKKLYTSTLDYNILRSTCLQLKFGRRRLCVC